MKSEKTESLDEIFADFAELKGESKADPREPITIWVTPEEKAVYVRLQKRSGRRLGKKIKQLVKTAIAIADQRAS